MKDLRNSTCPRIISTGGWSPQAQSQIRDNNSGAPPAVSTGSPPAVSTAQPCVVGAGIRNNRLPCAQSISKNRSNTSRKIGRKLHEVSQHHQVLCITHLAQIAVYADTHFQVRKEVFEDRTRSAVRLLSPTERDEEIARMVGGIHVGEATRLAAAEMIRAARGENGRGDKA